jgi:DNA-directed RNA polymerase specialized sigma24 family protein
VTEDEVAPLALRYQGGEREALELLHDRLAPIILSVLRPYRTAELPPTLTYQDVTQQTWIILGELTMRWQPHGKFLGFFFQSFPRSVQRFVARAGARRGKSAPAVISVPYDDLVRAADARGSTELEGSRLASMPVLAGLPPDQRTAFLMRMDGADFETIGAAVKISRASAHRAYRAAIAALQEAPQLAAERPTGDATSGARSDEERLVRALHLLGGPQRSLVGRRRATEAAGISRGRFDTLMAELEAAGAVTGRGPRRLGVLVDTTTEATLARLAAHRDCRDAAAG